MTRLSFEKSRVARAAIPLAIGLYFFFLQARFLRVAAYTATDEGAYAEVGRMMWKGFVPHRDMVMGHMPLLPFLMGLGLELFGSMYVLRMAFLLLSCLCVVPLYLSFIRLRDNPAAATLAVLFFLTFFAMVHHDYRFIAIRQFANVLLIAFLYLGLVGEQRSARIGQAVCALLSVFLYLPTAIHLALISLALVARRDGAARLVELKRYAVMGAICFGALALYFIVLPGAYEQIIVYQAGREGIPRLQRLSALWETHFDAFFYLLSSVSLLVGAVALPGLRALSAAMLGIFAATVFSTSSFAPHYLTVVAPALAFGVFVFADLVDRLCSLIGRWGPLAARSIQALAFAYHSTFVLAPLASEWNYNQKPGYYALIAALRKTPDPLLTIAAIYAVEADKELVPDPYLAYVHGPATFCSRQDCEAMAAKACTILLEPSANGVFAPPIQADWRNRFQPVFSNEFGTILLTNHPQCSAPRDDHAHG